MRIESSTVTSSKHLKAAAVELRDTSVESYAVLLRRCIKLVDLEEGRRAHSRIATHGLDETSTFLGNLLVQMYGSCRCVDDAKAAFDRMQRRNKYSWNILLTAYAHTKHFPGAKQVFNRMPYADIIAWTSMLMSTQTQGTEACQRFFISMPERCVISWNIILSAYAHFGDVSSAVDVFRRIPQRVVHSWNIMIKRFGDNGQAEDAKAVLDEMPERDIISWNMLLTAYAVNGQPLRAKEVFDKMPIADIVTWTSMLQNLSRMGDTERVKLFFQEMPERCVVSWNVTLAAYAQLRDPKAVKSVFRRMPQHMLSSWNILIKALGDGGQVLEAKNILVDMPERDVVSWNTFLVTCHQHEPSLVEQLFERMPQHDVISCSTAIATSFQDKKPDRAELVFNSMTERDSHAWSTMLLGYLDNGNLSTALSVFHQMPEKDSFAWSVIIAAYAQRGHPDVATKTISLMDQEGLKPCDVTYTRILDACADSASLGLGTLVHATMVESGTRVESDTIVGTSLVNMYAKCQQVEEAKAAFDKISERDTIAWTTMVAAYAQNGRLDEAESVFRDAPQRSLVAWNAMLTAYIQAGRYDRCSCAAVSEMDVEGVAPSESTFIVILEACACMTELAQGRLVHQLASESGFDRHLVVATGLINLYGKCGCVDEARVVFDDMPSKDVVAWTAMVAAYSKNGYGEEALELFQLFKLDGLLPNDVLFTAALSVCSHAGLVEQAREYFVSLVGDYGMVPGMDHYVCMVDMLGRAGKIRDSQLLLDTMPFEPHAVVWTSLMYASGSQGDGKLARHALEQSKRLENSDTLYTAASWQYMSS